MADLEIEIQKLNKEQRQAVETIEGPVMVVAGPGTGKTQMLAIRIAYILKQTGVGAENILCLTFTESGAKAMRERLYRFIGNDAYFVTISTFHGFSNEIIQAFPDKFSFAKELIQIDDLNRVKLMRSIIDEISATILENEEEKVKLIPFYDPYGRIDDILRAIQNLKKEAITPEELKKKSEELLAEHEANPTMWRGKVTAAWKEKKEKIEKMLELQNIYANYHAKLKQLGFYDYEDMIMFVIDKFKTDDSLLSYFQEKYLYIHVDEYQDTNGAQNEILQLLGNFDTSPNIFVVGDDDQAIYRFQGANLSNIMSFAKHFENVSMIPTKINYRSTQAILDIADSLIQNNKTRLVNEYKDLDKRLVSGRKGGEKNSNNQITKSSKDGDVAEIWEFNNSNEENIFIAKEIAKLHEAGVPYKEIAVIYRKNAHGEDINEAFKKQNIPTSLDLSASIFESKGVTALLELIRAIIFYDRLSDPSIYKCLLFEFLNIPVVDVYRFNIEARKSRKKLIEKLIEIGSEELEAQSKEKIKTAKLGLFEDEEPTKSSNSGDDIKNSEPITHNSIPLFAAKLISWHRKSFNVRLSRFMELIINESGLLGSLLVKSADETDSAIEESKNLNEILALNTFFDYAKNQERINPNIHLREFLDDIDILKERNIQIKIPKSSRESETVSLITAHSSKGLEFEYVFIVKATDNNWGKVRSDSSLLLPEVYLEETLGMDAKDLGLEDERRLFFVAMTRAKNKLYFTYANEYESNGNISAAAPSMFLSELKKELVFRKNVDEIEEKYNVGDFVNLLSNTNEYVYASGEKDFLEEQVSEFKLSPSALNDYLRSPQEFKQRHLLKVPIASDKSMALGTAVHYAIERFNKEFNGDLSSINITKIILNFEEKLKKEFEADDDFEVTLKEGKIILNKYFEYYLRTESLRPAVEVEYNFSYNYVFLDIPNDKPLALSGKIDKIEWISKELNEVKVVDYKTMKPKSENDIKGAIKTSDGSIFRQIVFYKLLSDMDKFFRPGKKLSAPKYVVKQAEIDFLRDDKEKFIRRSIEINNEDLDKLKHLIYDVVKRIRALEFPEKPNLDWREYL